MALARLTPDFLRIGFVPLNDCAPLALARELGLFEKYGLKVQLKRELGWATIRDKIAYGELDAAHALAGLPLVLGFGLGSIKRECVSALVLSLHGNAITISRELWNSGVRDAATLREQIKKWRGKRVFTFGVVFPSSSHAFLLRDWLARAGIHPDRDVRIVVVPPPQMAANLKSASLDGYCVGEPWNSIAVKERLGYCLATSAQLAPNHPEKVLVTSRKFAEERAAEHLALVAALLEACAYCQRPGNTGHVAEVLAQPGFLNLPAASLEKSLRGDFGGESGEMAGSPPIFYGPEVNEPTPEKMAWILRATLNAGSAVNPPGLDINAVRQIFRVDIYGQAQKLINQPQNQEKLLTHA